jgi:hypothetical protein
MNGIEFKESIEALSSMYNDVYLSFLAKNLQTLSAEKLDYCAEIASENYCFFNNFNISESKIMTLIVKTVAQDKDPNSLIDMTYADAIRIDKNTLPDLHISDTPPQQNNLTKEIDLSFKPERSQDEICENIFNIMDKNNPGILSDFFYQSGNVNPNEVPIQGWKFHISASSLEDYERLCEVAIPELTDLGIAFKIVRPDKFQEQMDSQQIGKSITIYPTESFDTKNFSPELRSALFDTESVEPLGDKKMAGRVYARYGRFQASNTDVLSITDSYGNISPDPKTYKKPEPDFLAKKSPENILGFYSMSKEKYLKTNDFKTYLQEKNTMLECDGKNHCYVAVKMNAEDYSKIYRIITNPGNTNCPQSFITQVNNEYCLMVHKSEFDKMYIGLNSQNIEFERFDWDLKNNYYVVPDKAFKALSEIFEGQYGVEIYKTVDNVAILQCDTVFNKEILESCRDHNIPVTEWDADRANDLQYSVDVMYEQGICLSPLDTQSLAYQIR